ncbi:hypothetical protein [Paenibacillus sanfengchensis]|uniref:hypothetical protein n=1 Tax=Paenibacillus sanfengchensis TaxID=3119819 RepID=UPI002FE3EC9A
MFAVLWNGVRLEFGSLVKKWWDYYWVASTYDELGNRKEAILRYAILVKFWQKI